MQVCWLLIGLIGALILAPSQELSAQFFTKSSKSIPRMGRRSNFEPADQPGWQLLNYLLETSQQPSQVDPLQALQTRQLAGPGEEAQAGIQVEPEAQPNGWLLTDSLNSGQPEEAHYSPREQRSDATPARGFAIRALQVQRYLEHLASGRPQAIYDQLARGRGTIQQTERGSDLAESVA